jgi:hypothetical protein
LNEQMLKLYIYKYGYVATFALWVIKQTSAPAIYRSVYTHCYC